jgi:hypothetical protein
MDEEELSSVAHVEETCVGVESKDFPPGMAHIDLCWFRNPKDLHRYFIRRDRLPSFLSRLSREKHDGFGACLRRWIANWFFDLFKTVSGFQHETLPRPRKCWKMETSSDIDEQSCG